MLLRRSMLVLSITAAFAAASVRAAEPSTLGAVEVTSSKIDTALDKSSATVTVIGGEELRARGATDLRTALALVAGVEASPGGDGGPASSVPALWGLREFDAFLLLVDGVPAGGAFVPALASLDLTNVERIEVMKGAAPVSYGATAFVGVIHVIHYAAGEGPSRVGFSYGSRGSLRAEFAAPLSSRGAWKDSLVVNAEHLELAADRAGYDRSHLLYRADIEAETGRFGLDVDLSVLRQDPNSPHMREGAGLTPRTPLDANHNPGGAHLDENRLQVSTRYERDTTLGPWQTRIALARTDGELIRGFLREGFSAAPAINADGYEQTRGSTDLYADTHVVSKIGDATAVVWGADWLHGNGDQESRNFEYSVALDGRDPPRAGTRPIDEVTGTDDRRDFLGAYADLQHDVSERLHLDAGLRLNHTREDRDTALIETGVAGVELGRDERRDTRLTGALGASYRLWTDPDQADYLTAYANYRDSFKPAVVDFGPEAETDILEAEEATSGEVGLRGVNLEGRLSWEVAGFYMDFANLVVPQTVDGRPGLTNAGNLMFRGLEGEARYRIGDDVQVLASWAYHHSQFGDYVRLFGDTPRQLRGNQQELSPDHLAGLGLIWQPAAGPFAFISSNYVGDRYLNKRNTAPAAGYATVDAGLGWRAKAWTLRVDGSNLTDRRDPASESELGDAQYYRLPARSYWLSLSYDLDR
ncbi:MAG: TonB-dependent receptor [Xanthomonadales bacterium]|nr:TonB-dependent receptor [Xanthomonadales bacterium]